MKFVRPMLVLLAAGLLVAAGVWWRWAQQAPQGSPSEVARRDPSQAETPAESEAPDQPEPTPGADSAPDSDPEADPGADPAPAPPTSPDDPAPPGPPATSPAPADVGQPSPWEPTVAEPPVSHLRFQFLPLHAQGETIPDVELMRWLEPLGAGSTIQQPTNQSTQMSGLFRLRSPWPEDGVLRMAVEPDMRQGLRLYVYHGREGAMLVNTFHPRERWAGYVTSRHDDLAAPENPRLASDDRHRTLQARRNRQNPLDLHWRGGYLTLASGDVPLVAVPLSGPPTEIFLEGQTRVYALELRRCTSVPPLPPAISSQPEPMGQLQWNTDRLSPKAQWTVSDDGDVELRVASAAEPGWAFAPLPPGFFAVEMEAEGTPGVGVYLALGHGEPRDMLRFAANENDAGRLSLYRTDDRHLRSRPMAALTSEPLPRAEGPTWLRLLAGPRTLHWWMGVDGQHWAAPELPRHHHGLAGRTLGVFHIAGVDGTLKLRKLRRAPLEAMDRWGGELNTAFPLATSRVGDPTVAPLPPVESAEEAAADAWQRLHEGTASVQDPETLLAGTRRLPLDRRLALLGELSQLLAAEDDHGTQQWLLSEVADLAELAQATLALPPGVYEWYSRASQRVELPSAQFPHLTHEILQRLMTHELLWRIAHRDWEGLEQLASRLLFAYRDPPAMLRWAHQLAVRELPGSSGPRIGAAAAEVEPIWIEQIDKTAFNAIIELHGLVESENWEAAAKLAATVNTEHGLAPTPDDPQRLTTFGGWLREACEQHEPLKAAMMEVADPVAQLHLRRAWQQRDAMLLEQTARRFPFTPAAGEAWQSLGDRQLADGDWRQAVACYSLAAKNDPLIDISAKLQLALELGGVGDPQWRAKQASYPWGEKPLSSKQVDELLAAVRATAPAPQTEVAPAPLWHNAQLEAMGRIEMPFGRDPRQQIGRFVNERLVDWCGRQLSVTRAAEQLLVCNRFQLAAFDARSGERLWQTNEPKDPRLTAQRSRDMSLTPSRPAIVGQLAVVRLLYGSGATLWCVDREDGQTRWQAPALSNERWVSDPVLLGGRLWCVLARPPASVGDTELTLVGLRPADGQRIAEMSLGRARSDWLSSEHCQLVATSRGVILQLEGAVAYVEPTGVRWVRLCSLPPAGLNPREPLQWSEPPQLSDDGQSVVLQVPRLPLVQCVDVESGAVQWQRDVPGVARLHVEGERTLVAADEYLQCHRTGDGELLWRHRWERRCRDWLVHRERIVCLTERVPQWPLVGVTMSPREFPMAADQPRFYLEWRDWESGRLLAESAIATSAKDPRVGPLVETAGAWWLWEGDGVLDATRTLSRLKEIE
ncbi:MAG: PQQ-binding-like beta-propeller repeat protein [Planctomycetales bacterium]|nr:PQQ-binding-like beta-propeller repeat protein [Planctomycetales bacterium]